MDTLEVYDYIIVGAGILGCATAKYLQSEIRTEESILLLDKYPGCGQGNTGKSNACYRNIFDSPLNIQLCNSSIAYYKYLEEKEKIDIGLKEVGYLWLLNEEQMNARKEKRIILDNKGDEKYSLLDFLDLNSVNYQIFSQKELKTIFPTLQIASELENNKTEITHGLLGKQCGTLAPDLLVKYYELDFIKKGGICKYGYEVQEILLKEKFKDFDNNYFPTIWRNTEIGGLRVKNMKTGQLEQLKCKNLILCTGAWINQLLLKLGIHLGVNAKKRQLFRLKEKKDFVINKAFKNKFNSVPFIILPSGGVFIKPIPENGSLDVGCSDDIGRSFELEPKFDKNYDSFKNNLDNPQGELEFYQTNVLPVLKEFFPHEFNEKVQIEHPSAGMYAYSLDKNPVITKERNLYICTGASGSGIMKGDAIARINVANVLGRKKAVLFDGSEVDVIRFSLLERNVPVETLVL